MAKKAKQCKHDWRAKDELGASWADGMLRCAKCGDYLALAHPASMALLKSWEQDYERMKNDSIRQVTAGSE